MRDYWIHSPRWLHWLYPQRVWTIPSEEKIIYLTFDDGPHPDITAFVLDQLRKYEAKGTFFCIGQNVDRYPEMFQRLRAEGHAVGNHTQHHLNGWKTAADVYVNDVMKAADRIQSNWFRPPYGRLTSRQARAIRSRLPLLSIAMWDVLSGDFDPARTGDWCASQVLRFAKPGSVVVMHDSVKAWDRLQYCLPKVLSNFSDRGFRFEKLPGA